MTKNHMVNPTAIIAAKLQKELSGLAIDQFDEIGIR
jgi:hypothetical protein